MIVLSHLSALEAIVSVREKEAIYAEKDFRVSSVFQKRRIALPKGISADLRKRELKKIAERYGLSWPIDVLDVGTPKRRVNNEVHCHVLCSCIPSRSYIELESGLYICSPELCLLQVANSFSFVRLTRLMSDLCSSYVVPPRSNELLAFPPITSLGALEKSVEGVFGVRGLPSFKRALRYSVEKSASPRETELALRLSLPFRFGGYALPKPSLNVRIELDSAARQICGKRNLRCDLFWPSAMLAVEYDSDAFHVGAERIAEDSARRGALLKMGITVLTVTNSQLRSMAEMDAIAEALSQRLKKRIRCSRPDYYERRKRLENGLRIRPSWGR